MKNNKMGYLQVDLIEIEALFCQVSQSMMMFDGLSTFYIQRRGFKSLQSNLDCLILKALNKKNKVLTVKTDAKSKSLV